MPVCSALTKKCSNSDRELRTTSTDWFWEEGGRAERTGLKRCFFITLVLQNSSFEVLPRYTVRKKEKISMRLEGGPAEVKGWHLAELHNKRAPLYHCSSAL